MSVVRQVFSVTETAIGPTCLGGCTNTVREVDNLADQVSLQVRMMVDENTGSLHGARKH